MKLKLILDDEDENIGLKSEKLKDSLKNSKPKLRLLTNEECYLEDSNQDESYLMEEKAPYLPDDNQEDTQHSNDKIMRKILKDRTQAAICLNKWLKVKEGYEIKEEELEEVTESYITADWKDRESDLVYKDKKYEGVFYLIEHQTKVNYQMARRIAEYKNEIRRHYQNNVKLKNNKDYKVAKVITIVLYIGRAKWRASKMLEEIEVFYPRMEEKGTDEYLLEETNEYKIEDLKKDIEKNNKDTLAKIFFIDKLGDLKDLNKVEAELDNLKITEEEINYIASYINKIIGKEYGKETSNQMIEILKKRLSKEEDKDMLLENFVKTCFEEGEKKGETRGISQVAINMLKEKCDKKFIKKCTGLSEAKLKELEKTLQSA